MPVFFPIVFEHGLCEILLEAGPLYGCCAMHLPYAPVVLVYQFPLLFGWHLVRIILPVFATEEE